MALTPRGRALRWLKNHRGITEDPAGSNCDHRVDGIRAAQDRCASGGTWLRNAPWCGVWAFNAALAGGVRPRSPWRWASVHLIQQDAIAETNGFAEWIPSPRRAGKHWRRTHRADLVILFGGAHVETLRSSRWIWRKLGIVITDGGNTSSGDGGSQSNGGGAFRRRRSISDIHGIARVNYPG